MTEKSDYNQKNKIKRWIAPTVISVVVFSLLTLANSVSAALAIGVAACIIVGGIILLRLL